MLWGLAASASVFVAPVVGLRRHGWQRGWRAILAVPGALMSFALVMAWIGFMEGTYYLASLGDVAVLLLVVLVGLGGVVLQVVAWRAALRKPIGPGSCQKCGYDLKDLGKCPECGTERLATTSGDGDPTSKATTNSPGPTPLDSPAGKDNETR